MMNSSTSACGMAVAATVGVVAGARRRLLAAGGETQDGEADEEARRATMNGSVKAINRVG